VVPDYVVIRSELVADGREARRYYEERLAGMHVVSCHGRNVTLFFERAANHVYTKKPLPGNTEPLIKRRLAANRFEERIFCLDRARLMDQIIPSVCSFTFSLPGTSAANRSNRLLHGPRLRDGRYLRVVLSPGPRGSWYCKSAYPIDPRLWMELRRARTVKFPP